MVEVEAVDRVVFGAGDFYGEGGPAVFGFEEGVDGLQEEGFGAGGGLAEFGVEVQIAVEVDLAFVEFVGAGEFDVGAGDAESELGEIDGALGHAEISGEAGDDIFDVGVFGFALTAAAEGIDLLLHAGAGEVSGGDAELAVDGHALEDVALAFPNVEFGSDGGVAVHDRLVVFHGEVEQVFDAGAG